MERKFRNPTLMIAVAMLMLVTGGFLTVLQVGISARRGNGIQHGFSFRGGAAKAEQGYFADLERGSDIIKAKASGLFDDIFGTYSSPSPADGYASAAGGRYRGYSADEIAGKYAPEDDAFEKYYKENYGSGDAAYSPSSSYGGDAGTFYGGGGSSGGSSSQDMPAGAAAPRSGGKPAPAGGEAAAGAPKAAAGPSQGTVRLAGGSAAPKLYASLPSRGADMAGYGSPASGGGADGGQPGHSKTTGRGGGLDSFRGGGAPKDLDGALESGRSGSAASYNAKMAGGAASAAAGGGAAPAASSAEKVSGGGSSGGGSAGGSSGSSPSGASDGSGAGDPAEQKAFIPGDFQNDDDAAGKPFLAGVVVEKRNGKDARYVTEEEAGAKLEEGQLKAGAAGADETPKDGEKRADRDRVREPLPPDPEKFEELSPERKLELKRRIHGFLKRVERRYGPMEDIFYTPCEAGDELCQEHELTEGYLTLETSNSAELHLGLKYIDERWRRYTVGFSLFDMKDGNRRRRPSSR